MVARPLTAQELFESSDLVGIAYVVSAEHNYAHLRFVRLLKGRPMGLGLLHRLGLARSARVRLRAPITGPVLGPWTDHNAYVPGQRIKTHLIWDSEHRAYRTAWWNAVSKVA